MGLPRFPELAALRPQPPVGGLGSPLKKTPGQYGQRVVSQKGWWNLLSQDQS
jgi:hypothetical protein